MSTTTRLEAIFHQVFENPDIKIHRDMTADEVPMWDSLTHMTLIAEIEAAFGFTFSFDDFEGMKNVGDMIDLVMLNIK